MQEKELKELLRTGALHGAYILAGEEDYLKRYYLGEIRRTAAGDEAFAAFNHFIFDGQDVSIAAIRDAIKAPPMFAELKLIEWRYPSFAKMKESDLSAFDSLLEELAEYDYSVLAVIVANGEIDLGTEKKPSKLAKRLSPRANILNFKKSTDTQLLSWLKRHFDKEGITVTAESLNALLFRSGHSMDVLIGEVIKLSSYLKANGRAALTPEDVNEVASSTPECDTFALSNAVLDRNKRAAFTALEELKRQRVDHTVVLGMLAKVYSELLAVALMKEDGTDLSVIESTLAIHPYKLKAYMKATRLFKSGAPAAILEELSRVDVGMKYGGVIGYTAIEMFISKCL